MTLFIRLTSTFLFLLLCISMTSCEQTDKKDLIVGEWTFEKFQFSKELEIIMSPTERKKANETNKGLVIKFTADNKYSSEQKGGGAINNSKGIYRLLPNNKLIIMEDTSTIIQLDKIYLKLYRDELSPIVHFRR